MSLVGQRAALRGRTPARVVPLFQTKSPAVTGVPRRRRPPWHQSAPKHWFQLPRQHLYWASEPADWPGHASGLRGTDARRRRPCGGRQTALSGTVARLIWTSRSRRASESSNVRRLVTSGLQRSRVLAASGRPAWVACPRVCPWEGGVDHYAAISSGGLSGSVPAALVLASPRPEDRPG